MLKTANLLYSTLWCLSEQLIPYTCSKFHLNVKETSKSVGTSDKITVYVIVDRQESIPEP